MTNRSADDLNWLTDLPPGPRQRWLSWGLMLILIGVSILAAPFSSTTLMERPAFVPMIGVAIFLCDLIAASLFFNYYHIYRSDILSILGCSHLFTASMVIIRVLSFPGGLTTHGVVGGSDQTPAWLYLFWHASFPIALLCYASVQDRQRRSALPLVACIGLAALAVVIAAWGATHLTAALPMVTTRNNQPTVFARAILVGEMIICAVGAAKLQRRRRSLLDQWLTVMASASILELIFAGMLGGGQFSVGFYFGRMLAGCTSAIILVLLLSEAAHVYARLARANVQLRREQSNRLLTLEAAIVSIAHELNQPLTAIAANGEAARRYLGGAPPKIERARDSITWLMRDIERASDVLGNVRVLFGSACTAHESVDINLLIRETLHDLRPQMLVGGTAFDVKLARDLPPLPGQPGQLREVIINLVQNASDAMQDQPPDQRMLQIATRRDGENVVLSVRDNGPGIAPDLQERIFDVFFTRKAHGTGLGLAICRLIVEGHRGLIWAEAADPRGAQFNIRLPCGPLTRAPDLMTPE